MDVLKGFLGRRRDPLGLVRTVTEYDNAFRKSVGEGPSPFHLKPCGRCHAPVWQQPCPICDFYPVGERDGEFRTYTIEWEAWANKHIRPSAFHKFASCIAEFGNIATWYFSLFRKNIRYRDDAKYRDALDVIVAFSATLVLPSAQEIWDAYGQERNEKLDQVG